jgi:hypothetical protein
MPALGPANAQELPGDEVQVSFNGYFDTYRVGIVYPTVSASRRVSESVSVSARYLVDAISAASMRSRFDVDGVTSATTNEGGGADDSPDELRQEAGLGVTGLVGEGTASLNVLFSTEHDYTSATIAARASHPFHRKNTELSVGFVRSRDESFPQTRDWRRDKTVTTLSAGVSRILGRRTIAQAELSYTDMSGFLSDPYQVVTIVYPDHASARRYEPASPDRRRRKAVGARVNRMIADGMSLQVGYRFYWDSWSVESNTASALLRRHFRDGLVTLGIGGRYYRQTRADFFRESYDAPEEFMTVDSKLDSGDSREVELTVRAGGGLFGDLPVIGREGVDLNASVAWYHRRTDTPDWFTRRTDLHAIVTSIGYRVRF